MVCRWLVEVQQRHEVLAEMKDIVCTKRREMGSQRVH